MPRNWNDDESYNGEDAGSQGSRSRSRSRSPEMKRDSGVITGTRAREICNDPDTINARVCVMDLNQSVDREMIEEYFTQFGKVVALFILRNKRNAFVQFEDEEEASDCLAGGETAQIGSVEATVKPAKQGGGESNREQQQQQQHKNQKKNKSKGGKKSVDFNDVRTADARVFVDPVNGAITKGDIEDEMSQFGRVLGVQIQSRKDKSMPRYAFVQFEDIMSARHCIRRKNMSVKGYNLMVRSVTSSSHKNDDDGGRRNDSGSNRMQSQNRKVQNNRGSDSTTADPMTASARIYVGNIQGDSITREDLRSYFANFGIVLSVSIHKKKDGRKGFAFVQFSNEEGAQNSQVMGKTIFLNGQQLDIGPVKSDQMTGGNLGNSGSNISPWDVSQPSFDSQGGSHMGLSSNFIGMNNQSFGGMGTGQMSSSVPVLNSSPKKNVFLDPDRPNDAEIVVASVALRGYAEYIEMQLVSQLNMKVDMIFPPPGLATSKIITDLIKRKCLCAIMVTEENERHKSVTLHVLQGPLQAHCNIPLTNALRLVEENFMEYVQLQQQQMMMMGGTSSQQGGMGMMMQQNMMGQGNMFGGSNSFGQGGSRGNSGLFGSGPSSFGDDRSMMGMSGGVGNNSNNGLLGPVPNDGLMGPVPGVAGGNANLGAAGGDVGNMFSLVLDSVKMARELRNVRGEVDIKEIMAGREFQERVAALKAKASAVKQNMIGGGGGGLSQQQQGFF